MQDLRIPTEVLLSATLRLLRQFAVLAIGIGVLFVVLRLSLGIPNLLAKGIGGLFALAFVAAPLASSSLRTRRGVRLFTAPGRSTVLFCFAWGAIVSALFMATLQVSQGMSATFLNYLAAMGSAGAACALAAAIPSSP